MKKFKGEKKKTNKETCWNIFKWLQSNVIILDHIHILSENKYIKN